MYWWQTLILSTVEGITEFLPISSTGHLIMAAQILHIAQTDFTKSFEIIIQLGAILGVVWLYWREILQNAKLWRPVTTAFVPTALVGFVLYKFIKHFLLGNSLITVIALLVGGVILIFLEKFFRYKKSLTIEALSLKQAVIIGFYQALSIVPGVSRAAATIVGGMIMGMSREEAVKFSFLLAIPTMAAASGLDLIKSSFSFSRGEWTLLALGFGGAFITAILTVKSFVRFVEKHNLVYFGVYRIIAALLFLLLTRR